MPTEDWMSRLAMVSEISTHGKIIVPLQARLEGPKRKWWNVNYLSHGWHRYVGRFPPQIIRALFNVFRVEPGDIVLDPFQGSGTTLVEARLLGLDAVGVEINPLSELIAKVKIALDFSPSALRNALSLVASSVRSGHESGSLHDWLTNTKTYREEYTIPDFSNKEKWFNPEVLRQLAALMTAVEELDDASARDFFRVAISASMRSIANVDVDVVRTEYRRTPRENVDVLGTVSRKINRMIHDLEAFRLLKIPNSNVTSNLGDARDLKLPNRSVDFIITSPPYGIEAISYLRTHMLSYRVLANVFRTDYKQLGANMIGTDFVLEQEIDNRDLISAEARSFFNETAKKTHQDVKRIAQMIRYFQDMEKAIGQMSRVLKDNGHAVIIIGNKKLLGRPIRTNIILSEICRSFELTPYDQMAVKLVCNNPNSVTPWSERMIKNEFILPFGKV